MGFGFATAGSQGLLVRHRDAPAGTVKGSEAKSLSLVVLNPILGHVDVKLGRAVNRVTPAVLDGVKDGYGPVLFSLPQFRWKKALQPDTGIRALTILAGGRYRSTCHAGYAPSQ